VLLSAGLAQPGDITSGATGGVTGGVMGDGSRHAGVAPSERRPMQTVGDSPVEPPYLNSPNWRTAEQRVYSEIERRRL